MSTSAPTAAAGYFVMSAAQVERYRHAAGSDTKDTRLAHMVERLRDKGLEVGGGQALNSAPRGYPQDHPRIELLRYKGLICSRHWPVAPRLHTAEAKDERAGFLLTAAPLHQWLEQNVGPDPGWRAEPTA